MKTHLSFLTRDLDAGVAFYKILLQSEPLKYYDDYALFVSDDPGLELALARASSNIEMGSTHYGIAVHDSDIVDAAIARLERAGHATDVEREETCCYAKQTKVWTSDPDGRRWEVYTVLEETKPREDGVTRCCTEDGATACCCSEPAA